MVDLLQYKLLNNVAYNDEQPVLNQLLKNLEI